MNMAYELRLIAESRRHLYLAAIVHSRLTGIWSWPKLPSIAP